MYYPLMWNGFQNLALRRMKSGTPRTLNPKVLKLMKHFQRKDGIPVHLKMGTTDQILCYGTLALCVVGVVWSFAFILGTWL